MCFPTRRWISDPVKSTSTSITPDNSRFTRSTITGSCSYIVDGWMDGWIVVLVSNRLGISVSISMRSHAMNALYYMP